MNFSTKLIAKFAQNFVMGIATFEMIEKHRSIE